MEGKNPFLTSSSLPFTAFESHASASPFAPRTMDEVPADAPEGSTTYVMVQATAPVPAEEVEVQGSLAVAIEISWGATVLHVAHLAPPRPFFLGEEQRKNVACDYLVPAEALGHARAPLVLVERAEAFLVVLPGATGFVAMPGAPRVSVEQLRASSEPCVEIAGAFKVALPLGARAELALGGLTFKVQAESAGRKVAGGSVDKRVLPYAGASAFAHVALLGAMAIFMPSMAFADSDVTDEDRSYMMGQLVEAQAEKDLPPQAPDAVTENAEAGGMRQGQASAGESGSAGNPMSTKTGNRMGIQGPADNADPRVARERAIDDARNFGMAGLLNGGGNGDPNAVTAPWGGNDTLGNDPMSALGNMWGQQIGESNGAGGLGLSGIGEGSGGRGHGIGIGSVGTIGGGFGCKGGDCGGGIGRSRGLQAGDHKPSSPKLRMGVTSSSGRLPPEVIQRVVRQNFGRFRACYETGLRGNPNLQGRIGVGFVIGRDGAVSSVQNAGSDLPDAGVVSCVVRSFYGLSFPAPDSGVVTVTYPIMMSPG